MEPTEATLAAVHEVGVDAVAIEIESPPGFDARPGQFVKVSADVNGEESRFYTVSSPTVGETFEITVEVDPEGALGPWLATRTAGDPVRVTGPFGNTYYDGERRVVALAGGPGVGPAIGIAERALADGGEAAVVYRDDAPMHEDRLSTLAAAGAYVAVVDEGDSAALAAAVAGALGAVAERDAPDQGDRERADGVQVFVYGFADFLDAATVAIAAAGGSPDRAKMENFG